MKLYLLRHGVAIERENFRGRDDSQRPLTPEGRKKMREAARGMRALELSFDLIFSSPYVRALDTAKLVAETFSRQRRLKLTELLTPGAAPAALMQNLAKLPSNSNVLLVGHEPHLSTLLAKLLGARSAGPLKLRKGALCLLTIDKLPNDPGTRLEWMLTSIHLARFKDR